jgi:hypothetical protein
MPNFKLPQAERVDIIQRIAIENNYNEINSYKKTPILSSAHNDTVIHQRNGLHLHT